MVKFGRHLEFFTAAHQQSSQDEEDAILTQQQQQQQHLETSCIPYESNNQVDSQPSVALLSEAKTAADQQHKLYVVPYNEIKINCIPTYAARDKSPVRRMIIKAPSSAKDEEDATATSLLLGQSHDGISNEEKCEEPSILQDDGNHSAHEERLNVHLRALSLQQLASLLTPTGISLAMNKFETDWRQCLDNASIDFDFQMKRFWRRVFDGLEDAASDNIHPSTLTSGRHSSNSKRNKSIDPDKIRGALPDTALRLYLQTVATPEQIQSLYSTLKNIHSTSLINSEALRKLVKKFDKEMSKLLKERIHETSNGDTIKPALTTSTGTHALRLSSKLLPEVYSANFNVGLSTIEASLAMTRQHLDIRDSNYYYTTDDEEYDDYNNERGDHMHLSEVQSARIKFLAMDDGADDDMKDADEDVAGFFGRSMSSNNKRDTDAELVEKRKSELRWLRKLVESVQEADRDSATSSSSIQCLVGHRGFHSIKDKTHRRPLENSLMAYEAAWTNGVHLCECDIALTRDDKLILAHDENFVRLALDPTDPLVHRKVSDLTHKEIMSLPLKSGVRPPLLFDVLRSAAAIGGEARMIVEIKPGNIEAGTALTKMFAQYPHLMERCAVVMSFDAFAMQNLRRELKLVFPAHTTTENSSSSNTISAAVAATRGPPPTIHKPQGLRKHHHRRATSLGSSPIISNIPTAMSIGGEVSLDHSAIVPRVDHDIHNNTTSTSVVEQSLFPPLTAPHQHSVLETIPGGVKVDDLPPHPTTAAATTNSTTATTGATTTTIPLPKLLVITRNGPAQNEEQKDALQVDVSSDDDMERLVSWLSGESSADRLDGLYMQYQPCMLTPEGIEKMRTLTAHYAVGIWGANPQPALPDDYETFSSLVQKCGVKYVNSSLPKKFFRHSMMKSGSVNDGLSQMK